MFEPANPEVVAELEAEFERRYLLYRSGFLIPSNHVGPIFSLKNDVLGSINSNDAYVCRY